VTGPSQRKKQAQSHSDSHHRDSDNTIVFYIGPTKSVFIITYLVLAILVSIKFTIIVLFTGLIILLLWGNIWKCRKFGKATIDAFRKMFKYIDDFWLTVKMAKVHNSEEFDKFNESNEQILNLHTDR
jgi:ATP-binding cassette subfamily C protein